MSEFFQPLNADSNEVTEIESLCVNCMEQGATKLMLTKIPFFRDVILSSFQCPHCSYSNSELSSALKIAELGVEFEINVEDPLDLNRLVVKSDQASVAVQELELEIPARTQKGEVTTIEGILSRVAAGLMQDQDRRKDEDRETFEMLEAYLIKIDKCLSLTTPFTLTVRDITGNSFVGQRPGDLSTSKDPCLHSKKFPRSKEEDLLLGIQEHLVLEEDTNFKDEVLQMATNCSECKAPCFTKMKVTDIPFFKEVIIMATDCDNCGWRTNEVKSGGGVEPKGRRVRLNVKSKEDLSRDVLKSDTCFVEIPELDLYAGSGTVVGKFTTVEGLLLDIRKQLSDQTPLIGGDSVEPGLKGKMERFCARLDGLLCGQTEFTLILDDPAGNCYIQNLWAPEDDPEMRTEEYERTFEQNEELGLNDMNVGYEEQQPPVSS